MSLGDSMCALFPAHDDADDGVDLGLRLAVADGLHDVGHVDHAVVVAVTLEGNGEGDRLAFGSGIGVCTSKGSGDRGSACGKGLDLTIFDDGNLLVAGSLDQISGTGRSQRRARSNFITNH